MNWAIIVVCFILGTNSQGPHSPAGGWNPMLMQGTGGWGGNELIRSREDIVSSTLMYDTAIRGASIIASGAISGYSGSFNRIQIRDSESGVSYSLQEQIDYITAISTGCPINRTSCQHGVAVASNNCQCMCTPRWFGPACNIHDCFFQGEFNIITQQCTCNATYDPTAFCGVRIQKHQFQPSAYTCDKKGWFGEECSSMCMGPNISSELCRVRQNWAKDECISVSYPLEYNTPYRAMCICGGGFSLFDRTLVRINYLECTSMDVCNRIFFINNQRALLCAPDIDVESISMNICAYDDVECCMEFSDSPSICVNSGCYHNGLYCVSENYQSNNGTYSRQEARWDSLEYRCNTSLISSVCNDIYRREYLLLYKGCDIYNTTCMILARTALDNSVFPYATPAGWGVNSNLLLLVRTTSAGSYEYLYPTNEWSPNKPLGGGYIRGYSLWSAAPTVVIIYTYFSAPNHVSCINYNPLAFYNFTQGVIGWIDLNHYSSTERGITLDPLNHCASIFPFTLGQYTYNIIEDRNLLSVL